MDIGTNVWLIDIGTKHWEMNIGNKYWEMDIYISNIEKWTLMINIKK